MKFVQDFVNTKGVSIHYIDNDIKNSEATTLLICPGLSESCEDYIDFMSEFKDRRCVALSFRGRGKSDSPNEGYSLEDHVEDIVSLVSELSLDNFCIMGISRGVSYALSYAISNDKILKGLIVGEYPAVHKKMHSGWAKESMEFYDKYCDSISITYEVLQCIEDESRQVNFDEELYKVTCPSLILKGELEETLLRAEEVVSYVENLGSKSIRIEKFAKAGHDIISGDFEGLIKVTNEFLKSID